MKNKAHGRKQLRLLPARDDDARIKATRRIKLRVSKRIERGKRVGEERKTKRGTVQKFRKAGRAQFLIWKSFSSVCATTRGLTMRGEERQVASFSRFPPLFPTSVVHEANRQNDGTNKTDAKRPHHLNATVEDRFPRIFTSTCKPLP